MQFSIDTQSQFDINILRFQPELSKLEGTSSEQSLDVRYLTIEFFAKLASALESLGAGKVSISAAWQVWRAISVFTNACRVENSPYSRIAYWYNIDPFSMDENQLVGLTANLGAMMAQGTIHDGAYDPTDYKNVYELFKLAYDDESLAKKQRAEAMKRYVDKCVGKS